MNNHYRSKDKEIIDFYFKNKRLIDQAKYQAKSVLLFLKKEAGVIERFDELCEKAIPSQNTVLFWSELTFVGKRKTFLLRFKIKLQQPQSVEYVGMVKSFPDGNVTVETCLVDKRALAMLVQQQIQTHIHGIMAEELFLKQFLLPLRRRFPDQIIRVHYAGDSKDRTRGIDFIIECKPPDLTESFEVQFNLKSSHRYIEKHKEKYPKVSTFVFKPSYLYNMDRLTETFFQFLAEVISNNVAHH